MVIGIFLGLGFGNLGFTAESSLRLANFLTHDQELTITVGTLGVIPSAGPGYVSGFIPAGGAVEIFVRERFTGKLILRATATITPGDTATLVLCGQPDHRAFPPQLLKLPALTSSGLPAGAKPPPPSARPGTFLNCDLAPATLLPTGSDPVPLPPGEPKFIPAADPAFTLTTASREKLPAPPLDPADTHLIIILYRPAPGAPAQLHVTTAAAEQIFVREEN
ncbi:MAG: hypothetical protein LBK60_09840 [Verrucomicrobiales bacterium]|nr:hypothetical protein [Verrucomicrobiales bacterium]